MMAHFRMPLPPSVVERTPRPTTMGDLQHFCLRWNNYQNSITTAFENLRDDEDFIDVTLACDGKTLKAHRVVLSACSPYFRELLKSTPCKHPVIVLQDVVFDDLHALVEFIYHGEVNVHQRNLTSFLKTAEVLKVSGLTQQNAAASTTPASSVSPSSDHYSENLSTRFLARSPSMFPQPSFNSSHHQSNAGIEDRNSPRSLLPQPQTRHRRHIRSPTPIRSSYSRDESPISLKRAKSADNASPLLNTIALSPSTMLNEDLISSMRTHKNSSETLSSSHRGSPNEICSGNSNNNNSNMSNYDENHNDEDSTTPNRTRGPNREDEPPVDFSTNSVKKYNQQTSFSSSKHSLSPKNLSLKSEPMDLVSNHYNGSDNEHTENPNGGNGTSGIYNGSNKYNGSNNNNSSCNIISNNNTITINKNSSNNNTCSNSSSSNTTSTTTATNDANATTTTTTANTNTTTTINTIASIKNDRDDDEDDEMENENENTFNDEDSNQSEDRLSDQSPNPTNPYSQTLIEHDDAFQGHRHYLDSKLFAAAGASFSFNMAAAALAADSLAGFNHHQSHSNVTANAVLDGLTASSQDWTELEQRGCSQGQGLSGGGGQQQHVCFICGKMLSTRLTLKRHIEQQHHQPLHSAVCTICHKVFRTLNSLNNHKSIYHRKPKWSTPSSAVNS